MIERQCNRRSLCNKSVLWLLFVSLLRFFLFTECAILNAATEGTKHAAPARQVLQAIDRATNYMVKANDRNGKFIYRVALSSLNFPQKKYNILRHAGAMYALAQAWKQTPVENVKNALSRSARFLIANCIAPIPGYENILGIWSLPQITYNDNPPQVKLGGAGLGLAVLVDTEEILPGTISIDNLRKIGRFLLFMQNSDGSFATRFLPAAGGKNSRHVSQYYPGEAALGLLMLYRMDRSRQWLNAAAKGLAYLIKNRAITTADQWSLIACAKLFSLGNDYPEKILPRRDVGAYARQVGLAILEEQILYNDQRQLTGCFNKQGRTAPTATRVEALFAILDIIGQNDVMLRNAILSSIHSAVRFLIDAQVSEGKYTGGIPRVIGLSAVRRSSSRRADEIRIDYVQHLLSALLYFAKNQDSGYPTHI